jgi:hypothetical protein
MVPSTYTPYIAVVIIVAVVVFVLFCIVLFCFRSASGLQVVAV